MLDYLFHLVSRLGHWGYLVIFVGALLECSAFLGVVVPGEVLVVLGGFLVAQGVLHWGDLVILVWLGATIGDSIGYEMGRHLSRDWLLKHAHWTGLRDRHIDRAEQFFFRHGGKAVLLGRFTGFLRALVPFVAGAIKMRYARFLLWNAIGSILWSVTMVTLGYLAGASWRVLDRWLGRASLILAGLVLFAIAVAWLVRVLVHHEAGIRSRWTRLVNRPFVLKLRQRYAFQIRILTDRLRPGGVFGLHLTVGVVVVGLAAWAFTVIADAIIDRAQLVQVDKIIADWLHAHMTPALVTASRVMSFVGSFPFVGSVCVLLMLFFSIRRQWHDLLCVSLVIPVGTLINGILKDLFERPRPVFDHPFIVLDSYSFPSGHANAAMLFYGYLAVLAVRRWTAWRARVATVVIAATLIVLIGFSRMLLGAHYLTDVLAAYAEGLAWLAICLTAIKTLRRSQMQRLARKPDHNEQQPAPGAD